MHVLPMTPTKAFYMTTTLALVTNDIDKAYAPINNDIVESIFTYYQ